MKTETIFFDAGNTLVYVNMKVVSGVLDDLGVRISPDDLWSAEHRARKALDRPGNFSESTDSDRWFAYFEAILSEANVSATDAAATAVRRLRAYHDRHNLWNHLPERIPPLLERLQSAGYRMAVVSNADGSVQRMMEEFGIARRFAAIIDSHVEGVEKPDPRLFRIALDRVDADPATTIHVGDIYHVDVLGARGAEITPVLLDPAGVHADKDVRRIRDIEDLESIL